MFISRPPGMMPCIDQFGRDDDMREANQGVDVIENRVRKAEKSARDFPHVFLENDKQATIR